MNLKPPLFFRLVGSASKNRAPRARNALLSGQRRKHSGTLDGSLFVTLPQSPSYLISPRAECEAARAKLRTKSYRRAGVATSRMPSHSPQPTLLPPRSHMSMEFGIQIFFHPPLYSISPETASRISITGTSAVAAARRFSTSCPELTFNMCAGERSKTGNGAKHIFFIEFSDARNRAGDTSE